MGHDAAQLTWLDQTPADRLHEDPEFQAAMEELDAYRQAFKREGGFLTTTMAGRVAKLSNQRMDQLWASTFHGYRFMERKMIGLREFKHWLNAPKNRGGRGKKNRPK